MVSRFSLGDGDHRCGSGYCLGVDDVGAGVAEPVENYGVESGGPMTGPASVVDVDVEISQDLTTAVDSTALRVAIVLVNWNGWRECIECIDSVLEQMHQNFHIFIVDNASVDDSIEHIEAWCRNPVADSIWRHHPGVARHTDAHANVGVPYCVLSRGAAEALAPAGDRRLTLVRSAENLGFAGGCNVGIGVAGLNNFDYFWFLNPDTVVTSLAMRELLERARKNSNIGIVGSTLRFYDDPDTVQALGGGRFDPLTAASRHVGEGTLVSDAPLDGADVERELAFVSGASMLVSTRFIRDVGLMQEDYFLYYEEIDWAMRGRPRFALGYAPSSHVFHKSGVNSSKAMPLFTARFFYRNRLRFVRRFLPERLAAAKRTLFIEMLGHLARRRWGLAKVVGSILWAPPKT